MTAGQVRVLPRAPLTAEQRRHPLATRTGVELVGLMLAADERWRPLSVRQKAALRAALAAAIPDELPADGALVELPALPADTHPATVAALARRGLAADGHATILGLQVAQYGDRPNVRAVRS